MSEDSFNTQRLGFDHLPEKKVDLSFLNPENEEAASLEETLSESSLADDEADEDVEPFDVEEELNNLFKR